ncbi:MAG: hhoA 2 [Phycisphaerales bacterium]|nr:hhoA 2 [Phycisphaerales bacterium]
MNAKSSVARRITLIALMAYFILARIAFANESIFRNALSSTVFVVSPLSNGQFELGSGVVIDRQQCTAVTAWHVVQNRQNTIVFFAAHDENGKIITSPAYYTQHARELGIHAAVVAGDPNRDVAVLQLDSMPIDATPVSLAAASPLTAENVHAIGNSGVDDGTLWRYSSGTVRSVYEKTLHYKHEDGTVQQVTAKIVETQCPTNPGDSGGPILNDAGELVAITTGSKGDETNVEYGIDVTEIRTVVNNAGLACGSPSTNFAAPAPSLQPIRPFPPISAVQPEPSRQPAAAPTEQPPTVSGEANASVVAIRTVPDVTVNGQRGLEIHIDLQANNLEAVPCTVAAIIADENGRPLPAASDAYRIPDGRSRAVVGRIVSLYDHSRINDIVLFIPYDELTRGLQDSNLYSYTIYVDLYDQPLHRWLIKTPGQALFRLRVPQA